MSEITTPEVAEQAEAPTINLVDIQNAVRVIDFAAEQGAFKGWQTIEQVLAVRNKLNAFVSAVAPAEEVVEEEAPVVEAKPKKSKRK